MNKKLEELFDLAPKQENSVLDTEPVEIPPTEDTLSNIEKIDNALTQVKGLEASDEEMDELADLAKSTYKDLMDLGLQTDSRFSSEIFNVASTMLGHAITAKTAKVQKKLKMIDLQLKKAALDQKAAAQTKELEQIPDATVSQSGRLVIDRNELIKSRMKKIQD